MKHKSGFYLKGLLIISSIFLEFISLSLQIATNRTMFMYLTFLFMVMAWFFIWMDEGRFG
jgi:hypothetical protein